MYSIPLPKSVPFVAVEPTAITNVEKPSYYSASFSPGAGYYVLNYQGPGIPWQKLLQAGNSSEDFFSSSQFLLSGSRFIWQVSIPTWREMNV